MGLLPHSLLNISAQFVLSKGKVIKYAKKLQHVLNIYEIDI